MRIKKVTNQNDLSLLYYLKLDLFFHQIFHVRFMTTVRQEIIKINPSQQAYNFVYR